MANKDYEKETVRGLIHYRRKCQFQKLELKRLNKKCNELQDRCDALEDAVECYEQATNRMNNRKYYKKFLEEYRQQEGKELSVPDFDYVYELYFEQKDIILKQKLTIKNLTEQRAEVLIKAINKFMSAKGLYHVVGEEILPWEPTEEVEYLFNMSISGDTDEIDKETNRIVEELIHDKARWKNTDGKEPYTCGHCGHKEMKLYTTCPNCKFTMTNGDPATDRREPQTLAAKRPLHNGMSIQLEVTPEQKLKEDICYATWVPILKNEPGGFQCSACNFESYDKFDTCPDCECVMLNADSKEQNNECKPEKIIPRCNKCANSSYCTKDRDNDGNCLDYKKDPPDGGSY